MSDKTKNIIYQLSASIVLLSAVLFSFSKEVAPYGLAVGSIGLIITTIMKRYTGGNVRGRRLANMQVLGAVSMFASAVFMYFQLSYWVPFLLIGAVLTLYVAIMLPKTMDKE